MGKRGTRPQMRVSTVWSAELAYAVGLITTDGSLSKDGRHIDFTSKDIQLLELFKKCLGIEHISISWKTGGYDGTRYPHVQFGDVNFYQWLMGIGLMPRKSLKLKELLIPDRFFFDFLRGSFDGDGTIYSYWDTRWHSSYMIYIVFASGSLNHLHWLQATIDRLSMISGRIKPSSRSYGLAFAKKNSYALFSEMFYKEALPCLERKFTKAKEIFAVDRSHNDISARVAELGYTR